MFLRWYTDKFDILHYDNIGWNSDSYSNNQFAGVWKSYATGLEKTCNWGELRIPFSKGLDIGAGEFSPALKYKDKGWDDLILK